MSGIVDGVGQAFGVQARLFGPAPPMIFIIKQIRCQRCCARVFRSPFLSAGPEKPVPKFSGGETDGADFPVETSCDIFAQAVTAAPRAFGGYTGLH